MYLEPFRHAVAEVTSSSAASNLNMMALQLKISRGELANRYDTVLLSTTHTMQRTSYHVVLHNGTQTGPGPHAGPPPH